MVMAMEKYSVLLGYPPGDVDNNETYFAWVEAATPEEAVALAREEAVANNEPGEYAGKDFFCLGVFAGHSELLLGVYDDV